MTTPLERIFDLIEQSGKSDYAIKKDIGFKNSVISEWRAGRSKPSTDAIIELAKYFNVSADYLLCLSDSPTPLNMKQTKKAVPVTERPTYSVALASYKENCENLASDEYFVNTAHLYAQLTLLMRSALYGAIARWLEDRGVNVSQILGIN